MTTFVRWLVILPLLSALGAAAAEPLPASTAPSRLLSKEGKVEVAPKGLTQWRVAQTNEVLQLGDGLRTGIRSRATLQFSDLSVLRVDELTTLAVQPPQTGGHKQLELKSGASYFFSRERPADIQFRTPVASGAIRGTEFNLAVGEDGRTVVTMLDGVVNLRNDQGQVTLKSGEQGIAEQGRAPTNRVVLDAINIIQWALYYPQVINPSELGLSANETTALQSTVDSYNSGDLLGALGAYPENRAAGSDAERIFKAALLLTVGQVDDADVVLKEVPPAAPLGRALRELIATVKQQPVTLTEPTTASEWMARSYYMQSKSRLAEAREAARQATQKSPRFGAAWIRLAEMEFSFGRTDRAVEELEKGLALAPRHAHGLALGGFLDSARGKFTEAERKFDRAIASDGAYGNAWLGRGLVKIRQGQRHAGRADLQVAATLEPQRSVFRSYLAKAFHHEGQSERAEKELALAKQLDPQDPTPWLYSALLAQEGNRVNEAVRDLEKSQDLNDNRSVYRSRLLLDQDQAVRAANLAAIYRDAGMTELSAREASRGVNYDYANYSAHLFLANSYDALRDPRQINLRYETPWFSELLMANLLAPVGAGNLSQTVSQQEYSRLFDGDHIGVYSRTEYQTHGEWQQEGSQYGTIGNLGYSLDAFYRSDPGQRPNNDQEQLALSAKVKFQLTPKDSIYLQAQYYKTESGDVTQYYDQNGNIPGAASFDPNLRVKEWQEPNLFLGYHREWRPGVHTLFLGGRLDDRFELEGTVPIYNLALPPFINNAAPINYESDFTAYSAELQQIYQREKLTLVGGTRYQTGEATTKNEVGFFGVTPQKVETDLDRFSVYTYAYWRVIQPLQLVGGVSYDRLDYPRNIDVQPPISEEQDVKERVSPKAGFYYTPLKHTTFRGVYTRSLGGLFYDSSVRLEPTQIAGFNQAFRSITPEAVTGLVPGAEFETMGLAVDQEFPTGTYISLSGEILYADAGRKVGAYLPDPGSLDLVPTAVHEDISYRERSAIFTVNQLLGKIWSAGAAYRYTEGDLHDHLDRTPTRSRDPSATLHQVHLYAVANLSCGFFAGANTIYSQQVNRGYTPELPGEDFWQHNVFAGYRFLQRRVEARIALLNFLDQDYNLNPLTLYSELPRDRTLAFSLRFYF